MDETQIEQLSPFELSLHLQKRMRESGRTDVLDAGRGNPNWTAPTPREAFFLLGQFATAETLRPDTQLTADQLLSRDERLARFKAFLTAHPGAGADFWNQILAADPELLGMPVADWLDGMCDAIIGDNYPSPARVLDVTDAPLATYMRRELFASSPVPFDVFPVEGGTAGICYIFDTLLHTHLLAPGDRIALFLPTFAPYIEIAALETNHFDVVPIRAKKVAKEGGSVYEYTAAELNKLYDPRVKAAFIVNPSNPTASAMSVSDLARLRQIVTTRPDLILVTDDVYGTFVPEFRSVFAEMPRNTICLYSFSKYYGATGWRVGAIAVAQDNVFGGLLTKLPAADKDDVAARYTSLAPNPDQIAFIDRFVADSRDVALHHAAGLSTVQQAMMALFSLYGLLGDGQAYKDEVIRICRQREKLLFQTLEMAIPAPHRDTAYYVDVDLLAYITQRYGTAFAQHIAHHWTPTKLLVALAEQEGVMLLKTEPFGSHPWSVRVSLANLAPRDYVAIGQRMMHLLEGLHTAWEGAGQPR